MVKNEIYFFQSSIACLLLFINYTSYTSYYDLMNSNDANEYKCNINNDEKSNENIKLIKNINIRNKNSNYINIKMNLKNEMYNTCWKIYIINKLNKSIKLY